MPPEAAAAAADEAERQSIWACSLCTLMNSSDAVKCTACGQPRSSSSPSSSAMALSPRSHPQTSPPQHAAKGAVSSSPAPAADKQKKKKVPKIERLRVTGGDGSATQEWLEANGAVPVRPQNAWTHKRAPAEMLHQQHAPVNAPKAPAVANRWVAQPGRLAQQVGAVQKAWAKD